jgi:protoheme IX farnesyltransferase
MTASEISSSKTKLYYLLTKPGIVYANVATAISGYIYDVNWHIKWLKLICLILGTALVIAASCISNNLIDSDIDSRMIRTRKRASVTKEITFKSSVIFLSALYIIGILFLLNTNKLTILIGLSSAIIYVLVYGFLKKRSKYAALIGTIPGSASLVAGYSLAVGHLNYTSLILFLIMFSWQMAHFYSIAIFRLKDYANAKVPVWSVVAGVDSTKAQIVFFICLFFILNVLMSLLHYEHTIYGLVMGLISLFWLRRSYENNKADEDWAKSLFFLSLQINLLFIILLPLGRIIP